LQHLTADKLSLFLSQTKLLKGLQASILEKLTPAFEHRTVAAGQPILPATATAELGFLVSGRATLRVPDPGGGGDVVLDELFPGDSFGEVQLLAGAGGMSVIADAECKTLHLRKEHFEQVINVVPGVAQTIARQLSAKYLKMTSTKGASGRGGTTIISNTVTVPPRSKNEIRFVETSAFQLNPKLLELVPVRFVQQHRVLPLDLRGRTITVGMVNPASLSARQDVTRVLANLDPEFVAITQEDFTAAAVRLKLDLSNEPQLTAGQRANAKLTYAAEHRKEEQQKGNLAIGEEVITLLDRILVEAVERNASDIHIESDPTGVRVRYRAQGALQDVKQTIPLSYAAPLVARVKVLADMDITERRMPQDGRISASLGKRELNFRISTMATGRGEKVVIRVLDPSDVTRPIEHIFTDAAMAEEVFKAVSAPHGAIIVAGPTGSGKSCTLYSLLHARRALRPDNNIVTIEDPIEYSFPGITQVPVNPKIGLNYAALLPALMRQDPDVIMVGELRDGATATMAVEAALTGHLLLTSIHANNAIAVIQRLGHLGVDPIIQSQAIACIIVQRLARRLCLNCTRDHEISPYLHQGLIERGVIAPNAGNIMPRGVGCDQCEKTGYKGRVPLIEILVVQDNVRAALARGVSPQDFLKMAAESAHFIPMERFAGMLIERKMLAATDALMSTAL
jgi:type IV pilus assembly protein PilB